MSDQPKVYIVKSGNLYTAGPEHYQNAERVVLEEDYRKAFKETQKALKEAAAKFTEMEASYQKRLQALSDAVVEKDAEPSKLKAEIEKLGRILKERRKEWSGCPCVHGAPCDPMCTCVHGGSSHGCRRCCSYGSVDQQKEMASYLIGQEAEIADRSHKLLEVAEKWKEAAATIALLNSMIECGESHSLASRAAVIAVLDMLKEKP